MSLPEIFCVAGAATVACGLTWGLIGRPRSSLLAQAAGMASIGVAGMAVLFGAGPMGSRFRSGFSPALGVDWLSGFFLLLLALIAVPSLYYARDAMPDAPHVRLTTALSGAFCLAMVGLLVAPM